MFFSDTEIIESIFFLVDNFLYALFMSWGIINGDVGCTVNI